MLDIPEPLAQGCRKVQAAHLPPELLQGLIRWASLSLALTPLALHSHVYEGQTLPFAQAHLQRQALSKDILT